MSPATGNTKAGAPAAVDVTISLGDLPAGTYTGSMTLARAAIKESIVIPVNVAVGSGDQIPRGDQGVGQGSPAVTMAVR